MNFSDALLFLQTGASVTRVSWGGREKLVLVDDDDPHIDMLVGTHDATTWWCSQSDLLADDWGVVKA